MARRGTNHVIWNTVVAAGAMLGTAACGGKQVAPQAPSTAQVAAPREVPMGPDPVEEVAAPPLPPAPELPPAPLTYRIIVESMPAGAEVYRDGIITGKTPMAVEVPAGTSLQLKLVQQGFTDQELSLVADADKNVQVKLEAAVPRPRTTTSPRKHGRGFILS